MTASRHYPEGRMAVCNPFTGIVRRVVEFPASPGDPAIFTALAVTSEASRLGLGLNAVPGAGVGLTAEAARWSAIGEAVERYASSFVAPERLWFGSFEEAAAGRRLADPTAFALFHAEQADEVPFAPFTRATRVAWVEGGSLVDGRPCWVPAAMVFLPYARQHAEEAAITYPTSTGLACGASFQEAALKALCEAVERDALMILWRNRLPRPRRHDFVARDLGPEIGARLERPGLRYTLVDMASDLPVAARLCVLVDTASAPPMVVVGAAAGLDPRSTELRAALEAAHTLKWMREQPPGRVQPRASAADIDSFEEHAVYYARGGHLDAFDFLLGEGDEPTAGAEPLPVDLASLAAALASRGLEPVAVDLTTEDVSAVGFHVVRVVVPGLQPIEGPHRYRFLGGRRLYEVPVRLGYRARPPLPGELDHAPHPLP